MEAESIASMFCLYDIHITGRIPQRLVLKMLQQLGFGKYSHEITTPDMSLKELLLFLDFRCPEPDPPLHSALFTFLNTIASPNEDGELCIQPTDITDFMESLGRPPVSTANATMLLTSMLDYDDCAEIPTVKAEYFERDVTMFAKKHNLLKDFK